MAELIRTRKDKSYDDGSSQDENNVRGTATSESDNNPHQSKKLKTENGSCVEVKKGISSSSSNKIDNSIQDNKIENNDPLEEFKETDNLNSGVEEMSCISEGPTQEAVQKTNSTEEYTSMECEGDSATENKTFVMESEIKQTEQDAPPQIESEDSTKESKENTSTEKSKYNSATEEKAETYAAENREENSAREGEAEEEEEESYTSLDIGEEYHDPTCTECKRAWKVPKQNELVMYLHAHSYKV